MYDLFTHLYVLSEYQFYWNLLKSMYVVHVFTYFVINNTILEVNDISQRMFLTNIRINNFQ